MKLANYKGLEVKKNELKVEEQEISHALDYLQKSRVKTITINQPAKKNNRIEIDFEARCNGVKIENGESKNHPLILGEGHFLPGFENQLENMKTGEEKEFSLQVPKDWPDKRVADKNLDFKVKMNLIQERIIPQLNDEFAKSLGNFDSLESLKKNVKEGLLQEKEIKEKERMRLGMIEKVVADSEIEISSEIIDQELENMINEFKASIATLGWDFNMYLQGAKKSIDDLKKEWREQAEKRVKIGICLKMIAEKEKIVPTIQEIEERMNQEKIENVDLVILKKYTENIIINEKVFALLEREATLSVAK